MGIDGLVFTTSCEDAQESTFCHDIVQCVIANCVEPCIWDVAEAYDCILEDATLETGCDVCPLAKDFMLAIA